MLNSKHSLSSAVFVNNLKLYKSIELALLCQEIWVELRVLNRFDHYHSNIFTKRFESNHESSIGLIIITAMFTPRDSSRIMSLELVYSLSLQRLHQGISVELWILNLLDHYHCDVHIKWAVSGFGDLELLNQFTLSIVDFSF